MISPSAEQIREGIEAGRAAMAEATANVAELPRTTIAILAFALENVLTLLASLSQELETAKAELRSVDAVMERRPALDQPTRWQNIQKAITMAAKADEAIRLIDAEKRRADRAEQSLETVKGELLNRDQAERLAGIHCGVLFDEWDGDWPLAVADRVVQAEAQVETVKGEREQMREALKKYGQHVHPCQTGGDWMGSSSVVPKDAVCDCGLESALLRERPQEHQK